MESQRRVHKEEVMVSNKALQLAKEWVKNMSGGAESDLEDNVFEPRFEMRPPRLGLGAKYLSHSQVTSTMNPVEKKLRAKISAYQKEKSSNSDIRTDDFNRDFDKSHISGGMSEEMLEDDNEDSRASAFTKKQKSPSFILQVESGHGRKKRKGIERAVTCKP